jgi:tetratricopeptide (TPR) repeat protein
MKLLFTALIATALSLACVEVVAQVPSSPVQSQFRQALELSQHGQTDRALDAIRNLLAAHPDFVSAWKLKGSLLEDGGHKAEAAEAYERGLNLAASDPDLLYKVGVYQLVAGDRERAASLLDHYVRLQPQDGDGWFYLAQAYHLSRRDDRALKAIRTCLQRKPNDPAVWQKYGELLVSSGDGENGFTWLNKAHQADPRLDRIDYDLGVASLDRMDFQNALQFAQKAIIERPEDANVLHLLASADVKLSRWQEAMAVYRKILDLNASDADALLGYGRCQLELKRYQDAIDTLNRQLAMDPTNILARYYMSRAYAALGNSAEARHQAELHQKMVEQTSFASSALGSEQDRKVWEQARKLIEEGHEEQALSLFRHDAKGAATSAGQPYFLVGALDLYLGKQADGLRNLHRALELDPKIRGPRTYLGVLDLQQNKLDQAEKEFTAEIANDPNYQTAVAELGVVRYRQQRWSEAADQLSRSHTRNPALLFTLCDAYFRVGRVKEANLTAELTAVYAKDDPATLDGLAGLLNRNGQTELAQKLIGSAHP